jgi:energy-converting hydrogenase Eha subunit F
VYYFSTTILSKPSWVVVDWSAPYALRWKVYYFSTTILSKPGWVVVDWSATEQVLNACELEVD